MASHDPALVEEDERLENLNIETILWYLRMDILKFKYIVVGLIALSALPLPSHIPIPMPRPVYHNHPVLVMEGI